MQYWRDAGFEPECLTIELQSIFKNCEYQLSSPRETTLIGCVVCMVGVHHNDNENCLPSMANVSLSDRLYVQYSTLQYMLGGDLTARPETQR